MNLIRTGLIFGFVIWAIATAVFVPFGHLMLGANGRWPAILTIAAIALATFFGVERFARRVLRRNACADLEHAALLGVFACLPGLLLDGVLYAFNAGRYPGLDDAASGVMTAALLLAYAAALLATLNAARALRRAAAALILVAAFATSAIVPAAAACYVPSNAPLQPPGAVLTGFASLQRIDTPAGLPEAIRSTTFGAKQGGMAAPGASWNATDTPTPGLSARRLIFAACDATLCLVNYEWGGIAHSYEVLALAKSSTGWKNVWHVSGGKPVPDLAALQLLLENRSPLKYYTVTDPSCY